MDKLMMLFLVEAENACTIWWFGSLQSIVHPITTLLSIYIVALVFTAMTSYFLIFLLKFSCAYQHPD